MRRLSHRGHRFARCASVAAMAGIAALVGPGQSSTAGAASCLPNCDAVPIVLRFDPAFARTTPATSAGSRRVQPGEEWDGLAPPPDPAAVTGLADVHQFQVLSGYDTDAMTVTISWTPAVAASYDLDLYVERLDAFGNWVAVGSSTNGQLLGDGEAVEVADVKPVSPGTYRTRVVNWASTELAYHGVIGYAALKESKATRGRTTEDRPDVAQGSQLHVLYVVPADGADEALDTSGVLENAVGSMNSWLEGQTGGRRLRLDTYLDRRTPRLDISFVRGYRTASEYAADPDGAFTAVTDELEERGWTASPLLKRYLVYYAGPAESAGICGTAYYNTLDTGFAQWSVVFLGAVEGCGARDFGTPTTGAGMSEAIALQELVHNEGIVRPQALHHCGAFQGHICTAQAGAALDTLDPESVDVMFPFVTYALRQKVLDAGRDDYFQHPFLHRDLSDSPYFEG